MATTDITLADFQPHELGRETDKFSVLLLVAERASERIAAAEESVRGGSSSTNPPAGLTNIIHHLSFQRGIAPPRRPTLVIKKDLSVSDLSRQQSRLSIPISKIKNDFLTDAEKQRLRGGNKRMNYLDVTIVAAAAAEEISSETAKLCRWDMRKGTGRKVSSIYAINGKWNSFVKKINLRAGMVVQVWFFRLRGELCFALVPVPDSSVPA